MIEMVPVQPGPTVHISSTPPAMRTAFTKFEYARTGDFYLGVNLDGPARETCRSGQWYFPGIADAAGATIVHLPATPACRRLINPPRAAERRIIEGVVGMAGLAGQRELG